MLIAKDQTGPGRERVSIPRRDFLRCGGDVCEIYVRLAGFVFEYIVEYVRMVYSGCQTNSLNNCI